jgi:hypothetical protein
MRKYLSFKQLALFIGLLFILASLIIPNEILTNIGITSTGGGLGTSTTEAAPGDNLSITCTPTTLANGTWAYLNAGGSPVQYLHGSQWYSTETGITWGSLKFTLKNEGLQSADVLISSDNWTGTGKTWYLADDAIPLASTIGLKAGIVYSTPGYFILGFAPYPTQAIGWSDNGNVDVQEHVGYDFSGTGDYTIIVKRSTPHNFLVTGIDPTDSVWWGFKILLPTSSVGNVVMTGIITLTAVIH